MLSSSEVPPPCGLIPVSGAALDLTDRRSFEIADDYDYYARRFGPRGGPAPEAAPAEPAPWQREASPATYLDAGADVLVVYAEGDYPALKRQGALFAAAAEAAGGQAETVVVPGKSHTRIVPTLSRDDQTAGPAVLDFVRGRRCTLIELHLELNG